MAALTVLMPMRVLFCWCLVLNALIAADADVVMVTEDTQLDRMISGSGLTLRATSPVVVRGALRFAPPERDGLTATVVARSLRGVREDDWRVRSDIAGSRQDEHINVGRAAGTLTEHTRFGIGGTTSDWNGFSIQWDGMIDIPTGGVELGTASDDGSRVWLDRNGDSLVSADEWGENGWGVGQGVTTRLVQAHIPKGRYPLRVQYEEGSGGNACKLVWRTGDGPWRTVPATAFQPRPTLTVQGPVTLAADVHGDGHLTVGDGVRLAGTVATRSITMTGAIALTTDFDGRAQPLHVTIAGRVACAGHALQATSIAGSGTILLDGGSLTYGGDHLPVTLTGPGELTATAPRLRVESVDPSITLSGAHYVVEDPHQVRARIPAGGPLARILPLAHDRAGELAVEVDLTVPADAPADLGIGAYRSDRHGRWFQRLHPGPLHPGRQQLRINLGSEAPLAPEEHAGRWSAAIAAEQDRVGLVLFGSDVTTPSISVTARVVAAPTPISATPTQLADLALEGFNGAHAQGHTGVRWQLHVRPDPYPLHPYDPEHFRLNLRVTEPDGQQRTFAGFHHQPMRHEDRGDREIFRDAGAPCFTVRFRPRVPGRHELVLVMVVADQETLHPLPNLHVNGEPWDDIVRPDPIDPRFFSADGQFVWPLGHNLHSTYDTRGVAAVGSQLTVDRGSFTREALLQRLAAAGGTGCETWLSAWNLGLEWNPAWSGYHGTGRYHTGHAWAVDRFLDLAEELGLRVNLSIFNHGMGRDGDAIEMEWPFHPWSRRNGGWLDGPPGLFTDARAFAAQSQLFRYITARYADSPALLGWKLWAEVDLVHAPNALKVDWHARASERLASLDPYGRCVTTHWCGDWRNADRQICAQPHIGYITIDAYHGEGAQLADVLAQSVRDAGRHDVGLGGFNKPVWVTEFGGSAFGCPPARLAAEHHVGPWVGFVTGHAASPLLWWFEWIDQGEHYGVYQALARFTASEDLRGKHAHTVSPRVIGEHGQAWCRAWRNNDRWLGFVLDPQWGMQGGAGRPWSTAELQLDTGSPGPWTITFWDSERGTVIAEQQVVATGTTATVAVPPFARTLAFKAWRAPTAGRAPQR